MAKNSGFPSDEELVAAIRRTQEEMRPIAGINLVELADEAMRIHWQTRHVVIPFMDQLVSAAHSEDPPRVRREVSKKCRETVGAEKHIKGCSKCQDLLSHVIEKVGGWRAVVQKK